MQCEINTSYNWDNINHCVDVCISCYFIVLNSILLCNNNIYLKTIFNLLSINKIIIHYSENEILRHSTSPIYPYMPRCELI